MTDTAANNDTGNKSREHGGCATQEPADDRPKNGPAVAPHPVENRHVNTGAYYTTCMPKRSSKKRPRDVNALAARIVAEATQDPDEGKNPAAVALGRLGGKKGGVERAKRLTPEQRSEIAKKAAQARWGR